MRGSKEQFMEERQNSQDDYFYEEYKWLHEEVQKSKSENSIVNRIKSIFVKPKNRKQWK